MDRTALASGLARAAALGLLLALPSPAPAAEPTPADLLNAARRAAGLAPGTPLPVLDGIARCTGPDGPFLTRVVSAPDGSMRFEQHRSSGQVSVLGIDTAGPWLYDGLGDTVAAAPPAVAAFLRGHEFLYLALAPGSRLSGPEPEVRRAPVDGKGVPTLRFSAPGDGVIDIHYDEATGRPLGLTIPAPGGQAGPPVLVRYDDWEPVGNLRLPLRISIEHGEEEFGYALAGGVLIDPPPGRHFERSGEFGADADLAELRRLQREARDAHLEYDAERLIVSFHDPLTGISAGRVTETTPAENRVRFGGYLKSVEFDEWADTALPRFRLSADRTMAYIVVEKRVRLRTRTTPPQTEAVQFAWMEAWEKLDGRWRLMAIASTDRPLEDEEEDGK